MQFAVPQFTEVEDKIIGGLTFKQFGIVFAAGVLIFAVYSVTKSIPATIVAFVFLGFPAAVLAFGKLNGRPIYQGMGNLVNLVSGNNIYFFHKQAYRMKDEGLNIQIEQVAPADNPQERAVKIQQLSYLLQEQREQENLLIDRLKEGPRE